MTKENEQKRILVVTQYFWPEDFRINDLCIELTGMGYMVEVQTGMPNYPNGDYLEGYSPWGPFKESWNSIRIFRVPQVPRKKGALFLVLNYLSFLLLSLARTPFLLCRRYEHIITVGLSPGFAITAGLLVSKLKGVPSSCWLLDLWPESLQATGIIKSTKIIDIMRPFFIRLYGGHSNVLCQSKSFYKHLKSYGVPVERLVTFPTWAEDLYQAVPCPVSRDATSPFVILFAGNLGEVQDLGTLVEAAEGLRDAGVVWDIYGDGRVRLWLEELVKARALEGVVRMHGRRPQAEMPELFSSADLLYLSLQKDPFMSMTLPGRLQSFLACGRPILGAIGGEAADLIKEANCGMVVEPGDVKALILAVRTLKELSPEAREEMGLRSLAYSQAHFSKKERMRQLANIIQGSSSAGWDETGSPD